MDREIKFRGKELKSGEWIYGDLHVLCDNPHIHTARSHYPYAGQRGFVDDKTIGQFTGLRDKSGREIYEGDIVVRHEIAFGRDSLGTVRYDLDKAMFVLFCKKVYGIYRLPLVRFESFDDGKCTISETYEYEVVGNVYDNPELLDNVSRK